jgi:hypothetical protein
MKKYAQPWLSNPRAESIFILSPAIVPVIFIFLFQDYFESSEVSTWWWVLLVLCIDVSHVYSTLFRLYWDHETFNRFKKLLLIIPVVALVAGFLLHWYDTMIFWRVLAYVAVFHFVRQQYGFMRLYSRNDSSKKLARIVDTFAIYSATVYPIVYWHFNVHDKLAWFVRGDFLTFDVGGFSFIFTAIYGFSITAYVVKEVVQSVHEKRFNVPKNMIVVGTYLSWYIGIVAFQGDLIFTLLNVVAHGIPYMALIWLHGEKKASKEFTFTMKGIAIFIGVLVLLAYVEENLWDVFVWQDHPEVFPLLASLPQPQHPAVISFIVALLVLPQVTHYILDGFIWRRNTT